MNYSIYVDLIFIKDVRTKMIKNCLFGCWCDSVVSFYLCFDVLSFLCIICLLTSFSWGLTHFFRFYIFILILKLVIQNGIAQYIWHSSEAEVGQLWPSSIELNVKCLPCHVKSEAFCWRYPHVRLMKVSDRCYCFNQPIWWWVLTCLLI